MSDSTPHLVNPLRRKARTVFRLGVPCLLVGVYLAAIHVVWASGAHGTMDFLMFFGSFLLAFLGFVLLLIATVHWLHSAQIEAAFEAYRMGRSLAHWVYPQEEWEALVQRRQATRYRNAVITFLSVAGAGGLLAVTLVVLLEGPEAVQGVVWSLALSVMLGLGLGLQIRAWARRSARDMRENQGHIYINFASAYCGDEFLFWGTSSRTLVDARLEDGDTAYLRLTVSFSPGFLGPALGVGLAAVGRPTFVPSQTPMILRIPVPRDQREDALRVAGLLLG